MSKRNRKKKFKKAIRSGGEGLVSILEEIYSVDDIKKLNTDEIKALASELRSFLVDKVSKNGGHLSSNLGVVELTIALCMEFDPFYDRIIWDVGHQSYVYKVLTGRGDMFDTLRKMDGLSGFPKISESEADAFNSGHSSTSVSAAAGFAAAEKIKGSDVCAVAVIGDGAMTGGMAFEALNHIGSAKLPVVVVLNDNGMSISKNVGGLSKRLKRIRTTQKYFRLKAEVKSILDTMPLIGKPFKKFAHRLKKAIRNMILPGTLFEDLGFKYLGPIDGHNVTALCTVLKRAKDMREPVIVHINTKKGKGYAQAEKNPDLFHGISGFDKETGEVGQSAKTWSDFFGDEICRIAEKNKKVAAVTAAMPLGTGLEKFAKMFPDRFFDVAIAEQHAVTFSAGLACSGLVPVVAVYSTFLQRAYDQIIHDVALMGLHVVFCIDRCGPVGSDGETHQGMFDIGYMTQVPGMTVLSPSNAKDFARMLDFAVNKATGPVAIRYPRGSVADRDAEPIDVTKSRLIKNGSDVLIAATGVSVCDALCAAEILERGGISAAVADVRCIKPIDKEFMTENAKDKKIVASVEDGTETGGFGQQLESMLGMPVVKFAYPDEPICQGSVEELKKKYGLDSEAIAEKIKEMI